MFKDELCKIAMEVLHTPPYFHYRLRGPKTCLGTTEFVAQKYTGMPGGMAREYLRIQPSAGRLDEGTASLGYQWRLVALKVHT